MRRKVMIVDNDEDILFVGKMCFQTAGDWDVVTADSGFKALELIEDEKPDVILLDAVMPEMDGMRTYAKLRETDHGADVPILFLTARIMADERAEYQALGAAGVISKPFEAHKLVDLVAGIIDARRGL